MTNPCYMGSDEEYRLPDRLGCFIILLIVTVMAVASGWGIYELIKWLVSVLNG